MAQAARLSLRMQKELKLLLSDPPPGASFPLLSADSDLFSLSSIDAQIEGPEETVYAKGIFHIKIQIPERYPFQPPSVTFATPIYHPNIDNGGRICLDILNLPPKGAWQPSLNISTVLTSIGLLLSEPNPDDGLMCEASREYKYNRQAFDQKARSMTEKYAKAGAGGNACSSQSNQIHSKTTTMEVNTAGRESRHVVDKNVVSHKKCGTRWKLSLDSSGLTHKRDGVGEVNEVPNDHILLSNCKKQMEIEGARKESKGMNDDYIWSQDKLCGSRRKLSLETFDQFEKGNGNDKANLVPNCDLSSKAQESSMTSSRSSLLKAGNHHYGNQEQDSKSINDSTNMISNKPTVGKKKPLGSSDACQISDGCNEEMIVDPCKSDSNASHQASPILPAVNNIEQPRKDFMDKMENGYGDLNCKRFCTVGKKLALGFRDSSQAQKKDDKENVVPVHKTTLPHPKIPSIGSSMSKVGECYERESEISGLDVNRQKCRIGRKLSLGRPAQLQRTNDHKQLLSHSQKLSEDPSKALHIEQDGRCDDKRKSNYDDKIKIDERIKRQKTNESPISESVIVLDSEDSEDEENVCLRSKSLLARKRIGKWRVKA
ncbi:uncharacterized protein LOC132166129 [Corylus avellana]|uniref:uncharacterized protein LOC132166129 n=1 Tax=Corylus avellana TaxID=13451 RepID=UPI001E23CB52|nr:uncharacterized protein LOC132166129 [Corylus avellana]